MRRIISISLMLITLILMLLPYGVAMNFAVSQGEEITYYYSYYNSMPIGYGNWIPIVTVISSVIIVLLLIFIKNSNLQKIINRLLVIIIIAIISSWFIFSSFTLLSLAITIVHIIVFIFQVYPRSKSRKVLTSFYNLIIDNSIKLLAYKL